MTRRGPDAWGLPAGQHGPPPVDVLIPTRNRPAELAVTLAGLAGQDANAFGVVVSDQNDGPADWEHPAAQAMLRVLEVQGRRVALLRHLPRSGLAEHRQFFLDSATAPRVLFLDEDVVAQWRVMDRFGGAGVLPSGAVHLESPTTVPDRGVEAAEALADS